jgi:hypothetical protein
MPDLVDKYFKEDLTEAEQSALAELLAGSDEASLKFEAKAKEAYLRYGFPDPQPRWPDSPGPSAPRGAGWGPWIAPALIILGIVSFLVWGRHYLVSRVSSFSEEESRTSLVPQTDIPLKKGFNHQKNAREKKPADESVNTAASKINSASIPSSKAAQSPKAGQVASALVVPVHPAYTPINLDQNPSKSYSGLSVQVGQSQLGFLTVRVLNNPGKEMVVLYRGNLGPGNWVFEWDGKSTDGRPAPSGYYQIEVHSGSFTQHKTVQIQ